MKEKQRAELRAIGGTVHTPVIEPTILLCKIDPKVEEKGGINRLDFNVPPLVSTDEWYSADLRQLEELPIIYLLALERFASELWMMIFEDVQHEDTEVFRFRRVNKINRIANVISKHKGICTSRGEEWPHLTSFEVIKSPVDPLSGQEVTLFLNHLVKTYRIEIPVLDMEMIVAALKMHHIERQGLVIGILLKSVHDGRIMSTVCINVAVAIVYLLSYVINLK